MNAQDIYERGCKCPEPCPYHSDSESLRKTTEIELFAWLGEDEMGSGAVGLKQGMVPAGVIPMVSISQEKLDNYWIQAEQQAATFGKRIRLCRFKLVEVVRETKKGI